MTRGRGRRGDQQRAPALEQGGLERRHAGRDEVAQRPADHHQVEDPADAADRARGPLMTSMRQSAESAAAGQSARWQAVLVP